jgi:ribosome-associated heat shock protein Hsp15
MRLDLFLDHVCLFKTRSAASRAIRGGEVDVNGAQSRASHNVHPGEKITIRSTHRLLEVEVLGVPEGAVAKDEARRFYRVLRDEPADVA